MFLAALVAGTIVGRALLMAFAGRDGAPRAAAGHVPGPGGIVVVFVGRPAPRVVREAAACLSAPRLRRGAARGAASSSLGLVEVQGLVQTCARRRACATARSPPCAAPVTGIRRRDRAARAPAAGGCDWQRGAAQPRSRARAPPSGRGCSTLDGRRARGGPQAAPRRALAAARELQALRAGAVLVACGPAAGRRARCSPTRLLPARTAQAVVLRLAGAVARAGRGPAEERQLAAPRARGRRSSSLLVAGGLLLAPARRARRRRAAARPSRLRGGDGAAARPRRGAGRAAPRRSGGAGGEPAGPGGAWRARAS